MTSTVSSEKSVLTLQAKNVLYLTTLTLIGPVVFVLLFPVLIYSYLLNIYTRLMKAKLEGGKTVLVTGAPHTKGLEICRILSSAGHRVILADMEKFKFSASRFSTAVDKWVTLPNVTKDDKEGYMASVIRLLEEESVDWWIPCSHTVTAVIDTEIRVHMETASNHSVKVLAPGSVSTTAVLDDKILFMKEARALGLPVPEFHEITSCHDVVQLASTGIFKNRHFFLKPLNPYSEDRVCFSRIPDALPELTAFLAGYQHKISPDSPYFVSEFVKGNEYTGTVVAKNGQIFMFVSNPSSPMQIDYTDASSKPQIYDWVSKFVSAKNLTGSLCFDFMEHPVTGAMNAIECNPRLHSAIVLMDTQREQAANAIYQALEGYPRPSTSPTNNNNLSSLLYKTEPVVPGTSDPHVYWLYNELAKLWTKDAANAMSRIVRGKDAVWDVKDPLPFLLLPHLQIPSLLLHQMRSGERWEIVNYCLGQLR